MKLKRFTILGLSFILVAALALTGCSKDDEGSNKDDDNGGGNTGPRPTVTLKEDATGAFYYISRNMTWPIGQNVRFAMKAEYDKDIVNIKIVRRITSGPGVGDETVLRDSTLEEGVKTFPDNDFYTILAFGPGPQQILVFTFIATASDGTEGSVAIEIRPDVSVGMRENQTLFDRNANGAYDVVQGIALDRDQDFDKQDLRLAPVGNTFKITSPNGSKFKRYLGSTVFEGFNSYERIESGWNASGSELNETHALDEEDDGFIMVKSAQNNRIYVFQVFTIENNYVVFDIIGEDY